MSDDAVSRETPPSPPAPAAAREVFGDRLAVAEEYAALLSTAGVVRGLIGPRETSRLWERHLLNCAVVSDLIPHGARVADVGSGAGLPGVVLALRRPDLDVTLLEPLLRRTTFLVEAVSVLGLDNVTVLRGRAEDAALAAHRGSFDVVTSRAVAPLDRLASWSLPWVRPRGTFLPMKGSSAAAELEEAEEVLRRYGAVRWSVAQVGAGLLDPPVTVVAVEKGDGAEARRRVPGRRGRGDVAGRGDAR